MSTSQLPLESLKRNGSLTRIDRVRSFLGKKGKTQSLISFFDQSSTGEKTSSFHYTRRNTSKDIGSSEKVNLYLAEKRRTQSHHLDKKQLINFFSSKSSNSFASSHASSTKESIPSRIIQRKDNRLFTPPSMSFPAHLRSQSQSKMAFFARSTSPAKTDAVSPPYDAQPWWDPINSSITYSIGDSKMTEAKRYATEILRTDSNFALGNITQDDFELPSRDSSGLLPLLERLNARSEISICSESSYATCPTPLLDEDNSSQGGSTPTLLTDYPMMPSSTIKDACQSPLMDVYDFPNSSIEESFDGGIESNNDCSKETEGLAVDDIDASVNRYIQSDLPGRQARLRKYSSAEQIKIAVENDSLPSALVKCVQKQLSLTDFLHELRQMPVEVMEESEAIGNVSITSSFMDEEEVDSAQICRAWRQNIAFANLGASHKNRQILPNDYSITSTDAISTATNKRPIMQKASRVSLRSIPLNTIEEISDSTQDLTLDLTALFDEEGSSEASLDLCAHLLRRAKDDVIHSKK